MISDIPRKSSTAPAHGLVLIRLEETTNKVVAIDSKVLRHVVQDSPQRPEPEPARPRDSHVVLATLLSREANVATRLASRRVADLRERSREIVRVEVAG